MTNKTTNKFSPEVRARAVRLLFDHEAEHPSRWAAISSIAAKVGCSAHTLNEWTRRRKSMLASDLSGRPRELRQANEILRKASAYFAQAELDRPVKR